MCGSRVVPLIGVGGIDSGAAALAKIRAGAAWSALQRAGVFAGSAGRRASKPSCRMLRRSGRASDELSGQKLRRCGRSGRRRRRRVLTKSARNPAAARSKSWPFGHAHEAHDQPDRDHHDGAEQEIAPQPAHRVEAHVPDVQDEAAKLSMMFHGIEAEHVQDDADQDHSRMSRNDHRKRRAAEETVDGVAWLSPGVAVGMLIDSILSCRAQRRPAPRPVSISSSIRSSVSSRSASRGRLVPAHAADARESAWRRRTCGGSSAAGPRRRPRAPGPCRGSCAHRAHRAEALDGVVADEPVDLLQLLVGEAEIGLADRHQLVAVSPSRPDAEGVVGIVATSACRGRAGRTSAPRRR